MAAALLSACAGVDAGNLPAAQNLEHVLNPTLTPGLLPTPSPVLEEPMPDVEGSRTLFIGLTYQRADGNRWADGQGSLPQVEPLTASLAESPAWVVGAPYDGGFLWLVTLVTGSHQAFLVKDGRLEEARLDFPPVSPGAPVVLVVEGDQARILHYPLADPAPLTHPILLNQAGRIGALDRSGRAFIYEGNLPRSSADTNAPLDGRLLTDDRGNLLLYSFATDRYAHGVLGDDLEAGGLTLYQASGDTRTWKHLSLPDGQVAEGISPIWVDFTGDGQREILVTLSNPADGARLALLDEDGLLLASSPPIGQGFRWRHQIAAAPVGPGGVWEIVSNRTPHLGGVIEYFQIVAGELVPTARLPGYSSHPIGSRNLDMAAVGDFDGDDRLELLIPTQDKTALGAIRRIEGGAMEIWRIELGHPLATNLGAAQSASGQLSIAVGLDNKTLLVWPPA